MFPEAISNLNLYFRHYNRERGHEAFDYRTPEAVYFNARQGPVETDAAVEICTRRGFPQRLENSLADSAFSQLPKGRRRATYQPISTAAIHL